MKQNARRGERTDWPGVWKDEDITRWDYLSQVIFRQIRFFIKDMKGKEIVELGSGSGRISMAVSKCGADTTLLDMDKDVLSRSKSNFLRHNITAHFIAGKFPMIPLRTEQFDVVWNAGVLEHFEEDELKMSIQEMSRICKKEGFIITFNPYSKSILHTLGSKFMMRYKEYPYRDEKPMVTMHDKIKELGFSMLHEEYSIGFFVLFVGMFKRLALFPGLRMVCSAIFWFLSGIMCSIDRSPFGSVIYTLDRMLSRIFGGYILVSVFR